MKDSEILEFEENLTPEDVKKFKPYMISYHFRLSQIVQLREQIKKLGGEPCQ